MKCSKCGANIPDTTNFCPSCGNPVDNHPYPPQGAGIVPPAGAPQPPYGQHPGQSAPGFPQGYPQPPYPPRKNNNVILISVIAVASVIICALLLLLFIGKEDKPAKDEDDEIRIERTHAGRDTIYVQPAPAAPEASRATAPQKANTGSLRNIGFTEDYSDYVCYRRLSDSDVAGLSSSELRILRNTIFARHGRKFKSADLRNYFSRFSWYTPLYDEISESSLTPTERHNIMLIKKYE